VDGVCFGGSPDHPTCGECRTPPSPLISMFVDMRKASAIRLRSKLFFVSWSGTSLKSGERGGRVKKRPGIQKCVYFADTGISTVWACAVHGSEPTRHLRSPVQILFTLLDLCVSSLRRGHANTLCTVPILTDDPRRESIRADAFMVKLMAWRAFRLMSMVYIFMGSLEPAIHESYVMIIINC